MLKIIVDNNENITIHHENGTTQQLPHFASNELVEVLEKYNINTVVELTELGNTTTHTVAELLELS